MPTESNAGCPNCGGGSIVEGRLLDQLGVSGSIAFRPRGRGWFQRDAKLANPVFACADCGLLWSFIEPKRVKTDVAR